MGIILFLLAVCWGLPTFMLMVLFSYASGNPRKCTDTDKKVISFIWWSALIGYPLGFIIFNSYISK